jgi:Trypsin-like peptidase domain/Prokaryotic RING finger family 1/Domain of unknown function (DUF4190)
MSDYVMATRVAGERETGSTCPVCQGAIGSGSPIFVCNSCGAAHHEPCWIRAGACASYECAPGHRELPADAAPALRISAAEVAAARPAPVLPAFVGPRPVAPPLPDSSRPRLSRLALASMITAIAGIPLFGALTGLVAVLLGAIALGTIGTNRQRGVVMASVGVLLGLADVVGWVIFLIFVFNTQGHLPVTEFQPDQSALEGLDPKIGRAMRSNVLITDRSGFAIHIGSGVIMRIRDGSADVLTNRHVVDSSFNGSALATKLGPEVSQNLSVSMVGQGPRPGMVSWLAPDGIDLALVSVPCSGTKMRATNWSRTPVPVKVGETVFAIGNPHGLGWTHTQGTVSQFRIREAGTRRIRVIQMQTAVNPGNSGGGLYDSDGRLVGIVTWSQDKRVSEGLNFAISFDSVIDLLPPDLIPAPDAKD